MSDQLDNRRTRLENLMSGGNQATIASCEKCGSTYFFAITAEQFQKGFGSVEYTSVSSNPKSVKICLCGTPLPIKGSVRGATAIRGVQEDFIKALNGAREYLDSNAASEVAKVAVSPREVEDLRLDLLGKINELRETIARLNTVAVVEEPKDAKPKAK